MLFFLIITVDDNIIFSQVVPQPVENKGIYDFLDELANKQIIEINSGDKTLFKIIHSTMPSGG